jgi:predicted Rossmann fold nucleotide-binding protein DprA/Smf involved in DNA uptake
MGFGRALVGARIPQGFRRPLQDARLLILSGFGPGINRVTVDTAHLRNRFLAALADQVFVAHARPGSRTEHFCQTVLSWGKPLYTLDSGRNSRLVEAGATPVTPCGIRDLLD